MPHKSKEAKAAWQKANRAAKKATTSNASTETAAYDNPVLEPTDNISEISSYTSSHSSSVSCEEFEQYKKEQQKIILRQQEKIDELTSVIMRLQNSIIQQNVNQSQPITIAAPRRGRPPKAAAAAPVIPNDDEESTEGTAAPATKAPKPKKLTKAELEAAEKERKAAKLIEILEQKADITITFEDFLTNYFSIEEEDYEFVSKFDQIKSMMERAAKECSNNNYLPIQYFPEEKTYYIRTDEERMYKPYPQETFFDNNKKWVKCCVKTDLVRFGIIRSFIWLKLLMYGSAKGEEFRTTYIENNKDRCCEEIEDENGNTIINPRYDEHCQKLMEKEVDNIKAKYGYNFGKLGEDAIVKRLEETLLPLFYSEFVI